MKKIITLLLVLTLVSLVFVGCGGETKTATQPEPVEERERVNTPQESAGSNVAAPDVEKQPIEEPAAQATDPAEEASTVSAETQSDLEASETLMDDALADLDLLE